MNKLRWVLCAVLLLAAAIAVYGVVTGKIPANASAKLVIENRDGLFAIGEKAYVIPDKDGAVNMALFVSEGKGTLIDAGFKEEQANRMLSFIEQNKIELQNIIITHTHEDHVKYLVLFKEPGINVFGPENTENGQRIPNGKDELVILDTPGHASDSHISVELAKSGILAAGDVVATDFIPSLGYGNSPEALIQTLEMIENRKYAVIIPGHGMPMSGKAAMDLNLGYVEMLREAVSKAVRQETRFQDMDIQLKDLVKNTEIASAKYVETVHKNNIREMYYLLKKNNK